MFLICVEVSQSSNPFCNNKFDSTFGWGTFNAQFCFHWAERVLENSIVNCTHRLTESTGVADYDPNSDCGKSVHDFCQQKHLYLLQNQPILSIKSKFFNISSGIVTEMFCNEQIFDLPTVHRLWCTLYIL